MENKNTQHPSQPGGFQYELPQQPGPVQVSGALPPHQSHPHNPAQSHQPTHGYTTNPSMHSAYQPPRHMPVGAQPLHAASNPALPSRNVQQKPNAIFVITGLVIGLCIGGAGLWGFQQYQERRQASSQHTPVGETTNFATTGPESSAPNSANTNQNAGYWLTEYQRTLLSSMYGESIIQLLDSPKGYNERDFSSRPKDVAPKDYYIGSFEKLFLTVDGSPMFGSLDAQRRWLDNIVNRPLVEGQQPMLEKDQDGDGIVLFEENVIFETSDRKADTDDDGFSDLDEIKNGFDPKKKDARLNAKRETEGALTNEEKQEIEAVSEEIRKQEGNTNNTLESADESPIQAEVIQGSDGSYMLNMTP